MSQLYKDLESDGRNENTSEPMRVQSDQEFLTECHIQVEHRTQRHWVCFQT